MRMTELEVIDECIEHWQDNLEKCKAITEDMPVVDTFDGIKVAEGFGIHIDSEACALCEYSTGSAGIDCFRCLLTRYGKCCESLGSPWKQVCMAFHRMPHKDIAFERRKFLLVESVENMLYTLEEIKRSEYGREEV